MDARPRPRPRLHRDHDGRRPGRLRRAASDSARAGAEAAPTRSARPLLLYGLLELGAAAWAVLALFVAGVLEAPYALVAGGLPEAVRFLLRIGVAAIVVGPGAFLLGATLPALVRFWVGADRRRRGAAPRGSTARTPSVPSRAPWRRASTGSRPTASSAGSSRRRRPGGWSGCSPRPSARAGGSAGRCPSAAPSPVATTCRFGRRSSPRRSAVRSGWGWRWRASACSCSSSRASRSRSPRCSAVFVGGLGLGSLLLGPWLTRPKRPDLALGLLLLAAGAVLFLELWVVLPGLEELDRPRPRARPSPTAERAAGHVADGDRRLGRAAARARRPARGDLPSLRALGRAHRASRPAPPWGGCTSPTASAR